MHLAALIRRETGCELQHQLGLSGKSDDYLAHICALGDNYHPRKIPTDTQVAKAAEILGFSSKDLRWWVDLERWYWDNTKTPFDLAECTKNYHAAKAKAKAKAQEKRLVQV